MEDTLLKNGWKRLASESENDYLYKTYKMDNLAAAIKAMNSIADPITKSGIDSTVQVALSSGLLAISINSPAKVQLNDTHFGLAQAIDSAL